MIATLDVLERCLGATVRAGREVGFSQAAQRSQRRAAKLLAALEALKPAEDGAGDGAWEEPDGLPPAPVEPPMVQVRPAMVEVVPEKRKQTGEAVLAVLRAAGGAAADRGGDRTAAGLQGEERPHGDQRAEEPGEGADVPAGGAAEEQAGGADAAGVERGRAGACRVAQAATNGR